MTERPEASRGVAETLGLRRAVEEGRIEDVVAELQARGVTQAERSAVARVLSALFRKGGREQAGDGFAGHAQA